MSCSMTSDKRFNETEASNANAGLARTQIKVILAHILQRLVLDSKLLAGVNKLEAMVLQVWHLQS